MTRFLFSRRSLLVLLAVAVLSLLSGCASFAAGDPRSSYRQDLWWLGAEPANTARWPAHGNMELAPILGSPFPDRAVEPATPSPDWPPL
ncbi:MAG: hypothetical protein FWF41_00940 [Betaproteobacteria bacterium]|nr:hypothetical protein [Betaproteobacteria bacterium]